MAGLAILHPSPSPRHTRLLMTMNLSCKPATGRSGWLLSVLCAALLTSGSLSANEPLRVQIHGVRSATGQLRVSLYRESDRFRKEESAYKLLSQPANPGDASLVFDDVPPGRYALMAYHDENGDNKLNLRLGMFPIEGYALSNNPKVIGPPGFADSAFDFSGSPSPAIELNLSY